MLDRADYHGRATRIVNRVLPALRPAHGWYDPAGFVARAQRCGARERLHWLIFAKLRAKAEGGEPYITLPKGVDHLAGGPMWQVAKELEAASHG